MKWWSSINSDDLIGTCGRWIYCEFIITVKGTSCWIIIFNRLNWANVSIVYYWTDFVILSGIKGKLLWCIGFRIKRCDNCSIHNTFTYLISHSMGRVASKVIISTHKFSLHIIYLDPVWRFTVSYIPITLYCFILITNIVPRI